MAYNYYQPYQPSNSMIWVSGETGAKAYWVAPNTTVPLWDSEAPTIYIKSADAMGIPSMETIDYTHRSAQKPQIEGFENKTYYAILEDMKLINDRVSALEGKKKKGDKKNESIVSDDDE